MLCNLTWASNSQWEDMRISSRNDGFQDYQRVNPKKGDKNILSAPCCEKKGRCHHKHSDFFTIFEYLRMECYRLLQCHLSIQFEPVLAFPHAPITICSSQPDDKSHGRTNPIPRAEFSEAIIIISYRLFQRVLSDLNREHDEQLLTHRFLMCETSHNIGLSSCSLSTAGQPHGAVFFLFRGSVDQASIDGVTIEPAGGSCCLCGFLWMPKSGQNRRLLIGFNRAMIKKIKSPKINIMGVTCRNEQQWTNRTSNFQTHPVFDVNDFEIS